MPRKSRKRKHSYEEEIIKSKPLTEEEIIENYQYTYLNDLISNSSYRATLLTTNNCLKHYKTKTDRK